MTKPKILVTSAAGNTGIPTTVQLLEKGFPVRALVRSDDHRAKRLRDAGAEIFVGDQYSITDMRRAMDGVQRAYHCAPSAPNGLHFGTVFAIAAQEAGPFFTRGRLSMSSCSGSGYPIRIIRLW